MTDTTARIRTVADLKQALRYADLIFVLVPWAEGHASYVQVTQKSLTLFLGLDEDAHSAPPEDLPVRAKFKEGHLYIGGPAS